MDHKVRTAAALTIAAGSLPLLGGCLVSSSNTSYETGRRISDQTTAQIEVGRTSGTWLIATLGDPTSRTSIDGDVKMEIWRYDYTERRESDGTVFLLFAGSSSSSKTSTTFFEITDGVVTNYWSE